MCDLGEICSIIYLVCILPRLMYYVYQRNSGKHYWLSSDAVSQWYLKSQYCICSSVFRGSTVIKMLYFTVTNSKAFFYSLFLWIHPTRFLFHAWASMKHSWPKREIWLWWFKKRLQRELWLKPLFLGNYTCLLSCHSERKAAHLRL